MLLRDEFVDTYAPLRPILSDPDFAARFKEVSASSARARRRYVLLGLASLITAFVSLEYQVFQIAYAAHGRESDRSLDLILGAAGLVAAGLIVVSYFAGLRQKWLCSVWAREWLRLWRHGLLLDGQLVDMLCSDRHSFDAEYARRWRAIEEDLQVADGGLRAFLLGRPKGPLTVVVEPPTDDRLAAQVLELQTLLRLRYQLRFASVKEASGEQQPSPRDLTTSTEWAATTTLVGAVMLSAVAIVIELFSSDSETLLTTLTAIAIGLAVASAAVRALRSGLTIPQERESYVEYSKRLQLLEEAFSHAGTVTDKWRTLGEVEVVAAEELHRFLTAKTNSRFVL